MPPRRAAAALLAHLKMGEFGQSTPLGRAGQPAELAGLFVALAEGGNSFTSGSAFGANGGTGAI